MGLSTLRRNAEDRRARGVERPPRPRPHVKAIVHENAMADLRNKHAAEIAKLQDELSSSSGDAALSEAMDKLSAENESLKAQVADLTAMLDEATADTVPPEAPKAKPSSKAKSKGSK